MTKLTITGTSQMNVILPISRVFLISPILVFDWSIFCCQKGDTSSKKEMKMTKTHRG